MSETIQIREQAALDDLLAAGIAPGTVVSLEGRFDRLPIIDVHGDTDVDIVFTAPRRGAAVVNPCKTIGKNTARWTHRDDVGPYVWATELGPDDVADNGVCTGYSLVVMDGQVPMVLVGTDPTRKANGAAIYDETWRVIFGEDPEDLQINQFFFDPSDSLLYVCVYNNPAWHTWQMGGSAESHLDLRGSSHVRVENLVFNGPNRETGQQHAKCSVHTCRDVVIADCDISFSDHKLLSLYDSRNCEVHGCDIRQAGCTGIGMNSCVDCLISDCNVSDTGWRHFVPRGISAGMKLVPNNEACRVQFCRITRCEYHGIWWDIGCTACMTEVNVVSDVTGPAYRWESKSTHGRSVGDVADRCFRGVYCNNGVSDMLVEGFRASDCGEGVTFANDTAGNNQVRECSFSDNDVMDIYLPDPALFPAAAKGNVCRDNLFAGPPKVGHPWGKPLPEGAWPYK